MKVTGHKRVKRRHGSADPPHVGPELGSTSRATACPSCGASLRPDALWCGQCHADFRPKQSLEPAAVPPTVPAPNASYGTAASDPLTQPLVDFLPPAVSSTPVLPSGTPGTAEPSWPCSRCDTLNPLSASVCASCGGGFLAGIRDSEKPLLVLPVVGDLGAMSRGRRLGLALALVAAVVLPIALLTLLLTDRPATPPDIAPGTTVSSTTG